MRGFTVAAGVVALVGCRTATPAHEMSAAVTGRDLSATPKLEAAIRGSPYAFFRFTNIPFSRAVCDQFSQVQGMPDVNLHGDAHLEQFAITSTHSGLSDFDDSTVGPGVLDLVRFGTAIELTVRERKWSSADPALDRFFAGYRAALDDPEARAPTPAIVERIRAGFDAEAGQFLNWVRTLMRPLSDPEERSFRLGYQRYVDLMQRKNSGFDPGYLRIKAHGRHHLGVGSALDAKILIQIEGPSLADEDDVVLEAKELRDLSGVPCMRSRRGNALRLVVAHARLSMRTDPFLAIVPRDADGDLAAVPWWVMSWTDTYKELDIIETLESIQDLEEVAFAVGVQLGRGHTNQIASPHDLELRQEQRAVLDRHVAQIRVVIRTMTQAVVDGWRRL